MSKLHRRFGILLSTALLLIGQNALAKDVRVVATTEDIGYLFEAIGKDHVDVRILAKGYQDPHYLQAKPSYITQMRGADLLAYVGLELEIGWLPLLVEGSRNANLNAGGKGNLPLSEDIEIRDVPKGDVDRSRGDLHPLGNPHYWLNPHNQLIMASNIADALIRVDPEHATDYQAAHDAFATRLEAAIARWEAKFAPLRGRRIVCYHTQWEYLTDWMGLEVVDYVENRPGIPPSPRHLHELEDRIKDEHIPMILMSTFFESGAVERVAKATGAKLVIAPASVGAEKDVPDVFALFDRLVGEITSALGEETSR